MENCTFIVDLPIKDYNFSEFFVCLPEGILSHNFGPLWVGTTHYHLLTPSDGDTQSEEEAWPGNPVHFHVAASTSGPHEAWQLFSSLPRVCLPRTLSRMAPSQICCFVLEQGSAKGKRLGKVCGDGSKRLVIFDLRALCRGPQLLWPKVAFQEKIAFWKGKPERENHIKSYQQTCGLRKHAFCRVSTEKYPNKGLFL